MAWMGGKTVRPMAGHYGAVLVVRNWVFNKRVLGQNLMAKWSQFPARRHWVNHTQIHYRPDSVAKTDSDLGGLFDD